MHNALRNAKKEGLLSYSNSKLSKVIERLKEIGFIVLNESSKSIDLNYR